MEGPVPRRASLVVGVDPEHAFPVAEADGREEWRVPRERGAGSVSAVGRSRVGFLQPIRIVQGGRFHATHGGVEDQEDQVVAHAVGVARVSVEGGVGARRGDRGRDRVRVAPDAQEDVRGHVLQMLRVARGELPREPLRRRDATQRRRVRGVVGVKGVLVVVGEARR